MGNREFEASEHDLLCELHNAYSVARSDIDTPVVFMPISIDGEELVLAMMHPHAASKIKDHCIEDPRNSGYLDRGDDDDERDTH